MNRTRFAPRARQDVLEITRWIARENRQAALGLRDSLAQAAERLARHPECGAVRTELADAPIRFLVLAGQPYILVYDSGLRPPLILRVLHGARDLPELLRDIG